MLKKIRLAFIGMGKRGTSLLHTSLLFDDIDVVAVCDVYEDRAGAALERVKKAKGTEPKTYTDYKKLLKQGGIDAVIVSSAWESHIAICVDVLNAGIITGMEVGGAFSLDECRELVRTQERTGTPFMFLENCCFDRTELMLTHMVRKNLFGELVHCSGGYSHDLRAEVVKGKINRHYRLRNYINRNCENYPTHELGPLAKMLNINGGNRLTSLVSVSSKAAGLESYIKANPDIEPSLSGTRFKQGDIVNTLITCAGGETISLTLDTTLPGLYGRGLVVRGTKGMYNQAYNYTVIDGDNIPHHFNAVDNMKTRGNNAEIYEKEFLPSFWKNITPEQKAAGHGGMDGFMLRKFFDCIKAQEEFALDVYDAATWMSVSCLSEKSILMGNSSVEIPDFTNGKWLNRKIKDVINFDEHS